MFRRSLFVAFTIVCLLLLASCTPETNPFTTEATVSHTFEVSSNPTVSVQSFNGRIEVHVGADDTVQADVIKLGVGITSAKATEDLDNTLVTFEQEGNDVTITAVRRESDKVSNSGASVVLTVPANSTLNLTTSNGKVDVTNVTGNLQINTSNGHVTIVGASGQFHIESNNGDINLDARNSLVYAHTNNGHITFSGTLADGPHTFETSNGDISLTLPADASFMVNANAANGEVISQFDVDSPSEVSKSRLQGTIGNNPGANVTLRTSNSDIDLIKATAE